VLERCDAPLPPLGTLDGMAGSDDRGLELRLPWGASPGPPATRRADRTARPPAAESPRPDPPRPPPSREHDEPAAPSTGISARELALALDGLAQSVSSRFERLEDQIEAHESRLEARLDKLQASLEASHAASLEAAGMLAGRLVARVEEQVAGIEAAFLAGHERVAAQNRALLGERHRELLAALEAERRATISALGQVASAQLTERLVEGVVALGEVLDAELVNLRRLLVAGPGAVDASEPAPPEPQPAASGQEPATAADETLVD
jgi:hypothetical protein